MSASVKAKVCAGALLCGLKSSLLVLLVGTTSVFATGIDHQDSNPVTESWRSIAQDSRLNYWVDFQGVPIRGQFKQFSVDYIAGEQLKVTVNVGSADMSDSELNDEIRHADWFDSGQFAKASFLSDAITAVAGSSDQFIAVGTLKLKGIEQPVTVPFNWHSNGQMTGELVLKRSDFSIGLGPWASGDQIGIDVRVGFDVHLRLTSERN